MYLFMVVLLWYMLGWGGGGGSGNQVVGSLLKFLYYFQSIY